MQVICDLALRILLPFLPEWSYSLLCSLCFTHSSCGIFLAFFSVVLSHFLVLHDFSFKLLWVSPVWCFGYICPCILLPVLLDWWISAIWSMYFLFPTQFLALWPLCYLNSINQPTNHWWSAVCHQMRLWWHAVQELVVKLFVKTTYSFGTSGLVFYMAVHPVAGFLWPILSMVPLNSTNQTVVCCWECENKIAGKCTVACEYSRVWVIYIVSSQSVLKWQPQVL